MLCAVEHVFRDTVLEITTDDMVKEVYTLLQGNGLQGVVCQLLDFFLRQVIDEILLGASGLDGKQLLVSINDDAMGREHFLPFLIGEIHIGSDEFLVRLGWLRRTWTGLHGRKVGLQVPQWVCNLIGWLLASFIIIAIAAALQLSWTYASVGMFNDHWYIPDTTKMEAGLLTWHPAEESCAKGMRTHRERSAILAHTHTIAM